MVEVIWYSQMMLEDKAGTIVGMRMLPSGDEIGGIDMIHFKPDRAIALCWRAVAILWFCTVATSACGPIRHDYIWEPYPIAAERVTTDKGLANGGTVSIINVQSDTNVHLIGISGSVENYASLAQFSKAIVTQLTEELGKRKITVTDTAKKSLRIKVTAASSEGRVWVIRAHLDLEVMAGSGYRLQQSIKHGSPAGNKRALNGVVALAVIAILNDPKIVDYLTGPS